MGVDLAGILLAGVGLGWLLRTASTVAGRLATGWLAPGRLAVVAGAVALLLCVGVLAPAWVDRAPLRPARSRARSEAQRAADATDGRDLDRLVAIVKDARRRARLRRAARQLGSSTTRSAPCRCTRGSADRDVDAIGFTFRTIASLSTDVEAAFDETNPAQYEMFNVRYLILPPDREPAVPATLLASSGRHRLYEVQTTGYFQVVDRAAAVAANRTNLQQATLAFRQSGLASQGDLPGRRVRRGSRRLTPTFTGASPPTGSPGRVLAQTRDAAGRRLQRERSRQAAPPSSCSRPPTTRAGRRP